MGDPEREMAGQTSTCARHVSHALSSRRKCFYSQPLKRRAAHPRRSPLSTAQRLVLDSDWRNATPLLSWGGGRGHVGQPSR